MWDDKRVVIVMPAYNAASTLHRTFEEVSAQRCVDLVVIVDDASSDSTAELGAAIEGALYRRHERNLGYGASQKTAYRLALENNADIVIMVHADYQYTPRLIPVMAALVAGGLYDCVIGSRILGGAAMSGGMPWWKYYANRFLTAAENLIIGAKLSEYHTGYRAFSRELLLSLPLEKNSDDFIFDNQMLLQILWQRRTIGEISCPARYFPEASSIGFLRSLRYGFACLGTALTFRLSRMGILRTEVFPRP